MKKTLSILLALIVASLTIQAQEYRFNGEPNGFSITSRNNKQLTLRHNLGAVTIESAHRDEVQGHVITLSGIYLPNEAGAPDLPSSSTFIAIPNGATASLKMVSSKTKTIQNVDLIPSAVPQLDKDNSPAVYQKDMTIYGRNAFYPELPFQISEVSNIRGVQVVQVGVMPFQYNPVTKELIAYEDIELELTTHGGDGTYGDPRYRTPEWDQILQDVILNRNDLPEVDYSERLRQHYENRETGCEYMIITPDNDDFLQLADSIKQFRTEQGIVTEIFTVSDCGGNNYQTIKSFIRNAYNTWDMPPAAVLFLGDHHTDPEQGIVSYTMNNHPGGSGYNPYISDHAYAVMDYSDMPQIIVGRITGRNFDELYHMIKKDLDYERTPPTDPNFYDHPITAMGFQLERWFQLCSEVVNGFFELELGKHPIRQNAIYQGTPGSRWSTYEHTNTVLNYFGPNGCGYVPQTMSHLTDWSATGNSVNEAINNGAFIIQHRDHGAEELWGEPSYSIGNIKRLNNKDLTFVMSNNCLTGKFNYGGSQGCFAEAFHRHQHGALGLIAATEVSYSFVNDIYVWGVYDNMWPEFMPTYGTEHATNFLRPAFGNAAGKYFLRQSSWTDNEVKQITYYLFHQHGDVFMNLYSEVPQYLNVNMLPVLVAGSDSYEITADEDATICLTAGDQIIGFDYGTGASQQITVTPQEAGTRVKLTITKQNHYRYEHELMTIPNEGPYLIFNEIQINDSEGNDNHAADYNEACTLGISLHNVGFSPISNVTAHLTCDHPEVEIIQADASYSNIPENETFLNSSAFTVHFGDAIEDGEKVHFHITMEGGSYNFTDSITVTVLAPVLNYKNLVLTDLQGTPIDRLMKGESVYLSYDLHNEGHSKSLHVYNSLEMLAPFISHEDILIDLPEIEVGESDKVTFRVDVHEDALNGCIIDYTVHASSGFHEASLPAEIPLGNLIEDFEEETLNPYIEWSLGTGLSKWFVAEDTTALNGHCLHSPELGDGRTSSMMAHVVFPLEDKLSFYHKTSTEEGDVLTLQINAEQVGSWSGISDWERSEYTLPAGTYNLKFTFKKDAQGSAGEDGVMIDYLCLPPLAQVIFYPGDDADFCTNVSTFTPNSYAYHYEELQWDTQGDGSFNDATLVRPTYSFGQEDLNIGSVVLSMTAASSLSGNAQQKTITVTFEDPLSGIAPAQPEGDTLVDLRLTMQSQYQADLMGVQGIQWTLQPEEAGVMEAEENRLSITWKEDFRGIAQLSYTLSDECGESESSDPLRIHVMNSTSVNELMIRFEVYPNPAQDQVRLQVNAIGSEPVVVRLIDNWGRMVFESIHTTVDDSFELILSTASLSRGLYHIQVIDGRKNSSQRLILQ